MRRRRFALPFAATVVALSACTTQGGATLGRADALAQLRSIGEAITAEVAEDWKREAEPSTMACGSLRDVAGRRWVDAAEGTMRGSLEEERRAAEDVFAATRLAVSVREIGDPVSIVEVVGEDASGLVAVLTLRDDGVALLRGESACFAE